MTGTSGQRWSQIGQEQPSMSRPERIQASNLRIVEQAERLRSVSRVPLLCECARSGCLELLLLYPAQYREHSTAGLLTAPGHTPRSIGEQPT
jgi:hypothetical protein